MDTILSLSHGFLEPCPLALGRGGARLGRALGLHQPLAQAFGRRL